MIETIIGKELLNSIENKIAHWHDQIEVLEVVRGRIDCQINGDKYFVEAGEICILNAKIVHNLNTQEENTLIHRFLISRDLFTRNEEASQTYLEPMISNEGFSHIILRKRNAATADMRSVLNSIRDISEKQPLGYMLAVIGQVHIFLQKLYNYYERGERDLVVSADVFAYRNMADYIYTNYMDKISVDDIAKWGNVSRSKAYSLFHKYAEKSPVDFLNLYRLKVSTDLLKNTEDSILEIAMASGFNQSSYFSRMFVREYAMTPSEYRKKCLRN